MVEKLKVMLIFYYKQIEMFVLDDFNNNSKLGRTDTFVLNKLT